MVVFFGAPHRGMDTADIERYLDANLSNSSIPNARQALVAELRDGNTVVERELQDFKDLLGNALKIQIISVYERKFSQRLIQSENGTSDGSESHSVITTSWKRNGEPYMPLDERSALLGFPASMEIKIPSDSDHSNMAKFDYRDAIYYQILHELKKASSQVVEDSSTILNDSQTLVNERRSNSWGKYSAEASNLSEAEPRWIPLGALYFPNNSKLESDRRHRSWLDEVLSYFSNVTDLSLKPRRFGILERRDQLEKVMVEFRRYPEHEGINDYLGRQEAFVNMARMLLRDQLKFLTVPLRGISMMNQSKTPCFLFIYGAENLLGLDEALQMIKAPTMMERLWLALEYAKAIDILHSMNICHGLINPYNLYLQFPVSHSYEELSTSVPFALQQTAPMLAGFDVAREVSQASDLIDVEDQDWRVYIHKDRLSQGSWKERQVPEHDVFSLGMVLIVIGLWMPFERFKKYQEAADENQRREFSMKLRKHFGSSKSINTMPREYEDVVSYCLGKRGKVIHQDFDAVSGGTESPTAAWVVGKLAKMLQGFNESPR